MNERTLKEQYIKIAKYKEIIFSLWKLRKRNSFLNDEYFNKKI